MLKSPELLLPAGDPEKLRYAVAYGADAVYMGLAMASLRTPTRGEAFTPANLGEHIKFAQSEGVKAYVTTNIFASNRDIGRLIPHMEQLSDLQPDAIILSDPGVFRIARKYAPNVPVHISTQANTLNVEACAFWQDQGVPRVILAREVPLREMAEIHDALPDLELECFIHGALCVAYSGRCTISDYLTDNTKNSNKGMCGNSCRWEFEVTEKTRPDEVYTLQEDEKGSYLLNSKDLCLLRHLPELIDAGICSFKAEGRTKGIHYVATVGHVYRDALDHIVEGRDISASQWSAWEDELRDTANRDFTEGFVNGRPDGGNIRYNSAQSQSNAVFVASVQGSRRADGRVAVVGRNRMALGDRVTWMTPDGMVELPFEGAVDIDGMPVPVLQPNSTAWILPPASLSDEALPWSLLRRREETHVAG